MQTHLDIESPTGDLNPRNTTPTPATILRLELAAKHLQISVATFRQLRFESAERKAANGQTVPGNGFAKAFLKLGRAVYVDIPAFLDIWRSQQSKEFRHD